ncbi:MAG: NUDIX hydrolase [Parcubacteria group bacterium GW2011_GWA2_51_10]|nr:MAG: NUDIX hydrolase [Parcubacteria group bacterium GW2011_GWA2_51_10]
MNVGEDYTGVSVIFFCHDGKGNVLLSKRSEKCRDEHGTWDPGAGRLEFGHTIEDTLRREILEEYGARVLDYEFLGYRDVHRTNDGRPTHWIALDFKVLIDPSHVRNGEPEKFDALEWFSVNNLPAPLHSQFPAFLELYKNRLR